MTISYETVDFDTKIANFHPRQLQAAHVFDKITGRYLLYGGAMGGGKSYWLRWMCVRYLITLYFKHKMRYVQAMLACEDYPSLKDRQATKIEREFPSWLGRSYTDHKVYGRCFILSPRLGNGVICLRNLDDASKYASSEFALIAVDELTKNLQSVFNDLRTRNRWKNLPDSECKFIAGTNPGSIGHGWVKNLWIKRSFPPEYHPPLAEKDFRPLFHFIPSKADDNPSLDASYWSMLGTLPKALRKAFRDGDWDTFIGQMFQEWDPSVHIIKPRPVPENAPIYVTYDWGFGAPFSMGWWWVDNDGRLYRFHECYGWSGESNVGLRLSDDQVAELMLAEERRRKINTAQVVRRIAGRDCFAKRANPFGGGQGPSTATVFLKHGLKLTPGDPDREAKIKQLHARLTIPDDGSAPMLLVYNTCEQFIRTIPDLVADENNIEDVDTKGEDHVYDEACLVAMARPLKAIPTVRSEEEERTRVERPLTRLMTVDDVAALEQQEVRDAVEAEYKAQQDWGEVWQ
jgi:hypothetical protein